MALDLFQSTLPAWGETASARRASTVRTEFQSTLPAWGETRHAVGQKQHGDISIHSPRMGRDGSAGDHHPPGHDFNPLSPHGERHAVKNTTPANIKFQSTLPAWGETNMGGSATKLFGFQSTLPAWGETRPRQSPPLGAGDFNPLSPHGERLRTTSPVSWRHLFQSTLPAWGETRLSQS